MGKLPWKPDCYQRNGLALDPATNAIYISFGHCSHGWISGLRQGGPAQTAILNVTPDGAGGGLWGGTPAIDDSTGDIYLITGVDLDDPAPDYNDSAMRLQASDLNVLDYFKPSNEAYLRRATMPTWAADRPIIMPDNPSQYPHELIGGGKDGRIFVINRDNMGQFQTTDHVIQEVQTGTQEFDNIFTTPTFWNNTIYYHCAQDVVKAYSWDPNTGLDFDFVDFGRNNSFRRTWSEYLVIGQWHLRWVAMGNRHQQCGQWRICRAARHRRGQPGQRAL